MELTRPQQQMSISVSFKNKKLHQNEQISQLDEYYIVQYDARMFNGKIAWKR